MYSSYKRGLIQPGIDSKGYYYAALATEFGPKNMRIHILVLMSFAYFPGCETTMINHCDGIKTHCDVWNLEWSSYSENSLHAYSTGLRQNFWNQRSLTDEEVITIADLLMENKLTCTEIANMFNVSVDMIYSIKFKRAYFNLTSSYNFPSFKVERDTVEKICQVMVQNKPDKSLNDMNKTEKHDYYQKKNNKRNWNGKFTKFRLFNKKII